jgi:HPt (histidine-containing phosphotransfer) domain-containing protein
MKQNRPPNELLDAARLLSISRGNPARAQDLVRQFLAVLPEEKAMIEQAYAAQEDLETVRSVAHRLNSGGQYTGFMRISAAAKFLEQLIDDSAPQENIVFALEQLNREIQVVLDQPTERLFALLVKNGHE